VREGESVREKEWEEKSVFGVVDLVRLRCINVRVHSMRERERERERESE
jgi:hypothetical protein